MNEDTQFLRELDAFLSSGNPGRFQAVLQTLAKHTAAAFEGAARANNGELRQFCEIAFPALMMWKPKGAKERAMRSMSVNNLPARSCYRMLRFSEPIHSEAVQEAWTAYIHEFQPPKDK